MHVRNGYNKLDGRRFVEPRFIFNTRQLLPAIKKDVLPSHHHSNVIYQFVCHCDSRYVGRASQRLEERIKQHVPRSIANPPASHNRQSLPALARPTHTHNNFTNSPLVNIFLTTLNALFTTATKNFLFSLEVALLFAFLLLKRLSLNLSIPFCVNKKKFVYSLKISLSFFSLTNFFQAMRTLLSLYNSVRFQFCFILTTSPEECQMKSFGRKNLLLQAN